MKFVLSIFTLLYMPTIAWAHTGHDGIGLFHHLFDILPIIAVVILVAGAYIWKRKH